jgi:uncharacterized protein (UPF0332 family)
VKLTDEDDPDCAHATLLKIGDKWFIAFDFRYNKALAKRHSDAAREFYRVAEFAKENGYWSPFIDSLFSASELAAKAILLSEPSPKLRKKGTHKVIHRKFNIHAKLGNVKPEHSKAFNKLWSLRSKARYLEGKFTISVSEAELLLEVVGELIEVSIERMRTFE